MNLSQWVCITLYQERKSTPKSNTGKIEINKILVQIVHRIKSDHLSKEDRVFNLRLPDSLLNCISPPTLPTTHTCAHIPLLSS